MKRTPARMVDVDTLGRWLYLYERAANESSRGVVLRLAGACVLGQIPKITNGYRAGRAGQIAKIANG